jgi:hypothetical protein
LRPWMQGAGMLTRCRRLSGLTDESHLPFWSTGLGSSRCARLAHVLEGVRVSRARFALLARASPPPPGERIQEQQRRCSYPDLLFLPEPTTGQSITAMLHNRLKEVQT